MTAKNYPDLAQYTTPKSQFPHSHCALLPDEAMIDPEPISIHGSGEERITVYAYLIPSNGFEGRFATTNGDPIYEEDDPELFAEALAHADARDRVA